MARDASYSEDFDESNVSASPRGSQDASEIQSEIEEDSIAESLDENVASEAASSNGLSGRSNQKSGAATAEAQSAAPLDSARRHASEQTEEEAYSEDFAEQTGTAILESPRSARMTARSSGSVEPVEEVSEIASALGASSREAGSTSRAAVGLRLEAPASLAPQSQDAAQINDEIQSGDSDDPEYSEAFAEQTSVLESSRRSANALKEDRVRAGGDSAASSDPAYSDDFSETGALDASRRSAEASRQRTAERPPHSARSALAVTFEADRQDELQDRAGDDRADATAASSDPAYSDDFSEHTAGALDSSRRSSGDARPRSEATEQEESVRPPESAPSAELVRPARPSLSVSFGAESRDLDPCDDADQTEVSEDILDDPEYSEDFAEQTGAAESSVRSEDASVSAAARQDCAQKTSPQLMLQRPEERLSAQDGRGELLEADSLVPIPPLDRPSQDEPSSSGQQCEDEPSRLGQQRSGKQYAQEDAIPSRQQSPRAQLEEDACVVATIPQDCMQKSSPRFMQQRPEQRLSPTGQGCGGELTEAGSLIRPASSSRPSEDQLSPAKQESLRKKLLPPEETGRLSQQSPRKELEQDCRSAMDSQAHRESRMPLSEELASAELPSQASGQERDEGPKSQDNASKPSPEIDGHHLPVVKQSSLNESSVLLAGTNDQDRPRGESRREHDSPKKDIQDRDGEHRSKNDPPKLSPGIDGRGSQDGESSRQNHSPKPSAERDVKDFREGDQRRHCTSLQEHREMGIPRRRQGEPQRPQDSPKPNLDRDDPDGEESETMRNHDSLKLPTERARPDFDEVAEARPQDSPVLPSVIGGQTNLRDPTVFLAVAKQLGASNAKVEIDGSVVKEASGQHDSTSSRIGAQHDAPSQCRDDTRFKCHGVEVEDQGGATIWTARLNVQPGEHHTSQIPAAREGQLSGLQIGPGPEHFAEGEVEFTSLRPERLRGVEAEPRAALNASHGPSEGCPLGVSNQDMPEGVSPLQLRESRFETSYGGAHWDSFDSTALRPRSWYSVHDNNFHYDENAACEKDFYGRGRDDSQSDWIWSCSTDWEWKSSSRWHSNPWERHCQSWSWTQPWTASRWSSSWDNDSIDFGWCSFDQWHRCAEEPCRSGELHDEAHGAPSPRDGRCQVGAEKKVGAPSPRDGRPQVGADNKVAPPLSPSSRDDSPIATRSVGVDTSDWQRLDAILPPKAESDVDRWLSGACRPGRGDEQRRRSRDPPLTISIDVQTTPDSRQRPDCELNDFVSASACRSKLVDSDGPFGDLVRATATVLDEMLQFKYGWGLDTADFMAKAHIVGDAQSPMSACQFAAWISSRTDFWCHDWKRQRLLKLQIQSWSVQCFIDLRARLQLLPGIANAVAFTSVSGGYAMHVSAAFRTPCVDVNCIVSRSCGPNAEAKALYFREADFIGAVALEPTILAVSSIDSASDGTDCWRADEAPACTPEFCALEGLLHRGGRMERSTPHNVSQRVLPTEIRDAMQVSTPTTSSMRLLACFLMRSDVNPDRVLEILETMVSWLDSADAVTATLARRIFNETLNISESVVSSLHRCVERCEVVRAACRVVCCAAKRHAEIAASFVAVGAVKEICEVLERYPGDKVVQRHGLHGLSCLVHLGGGATSATLAGAVALTLKSMALHRQSASIQVLGCETLRGLLELGEARADEIGHAGHAAKRAFPSNGVVHKAADMLLALVVRRLATSIGTLMDSHLADEATQRSGMSSLGQLAAHGGVAWRLAATSAVGRILRAMSLHARKSETQAVGLWALSRLAERVEAPRIGLQGAADRAKKLHPESLVVKQQADQLSAVLLRC